MEGENVAKDGTSRGGWRPGAGSKKKPLVDKIREGKPGESIAIDPEREARTEKPVLHDFGQQEMEDPLLTQQILDSTWEWLKERECASLIQPQLLEQYALNCSRWIECEREVTREGYTAPGPASKGMIIHPIVKVALEYSRHTNQLWAQIYQIVRENSIVEYQAKGAQDDMEMLLEGLL